MFYKRFAIIFRKIHLVLLIIQGQELILKTNNQQKSYTKRKTHLPFNDNILSKLKDMPMISKFNVLQMLLVNLNGLKTL